MRRGPALVGVLALVFAEAMGASTTGVPVAHAQGQNAASLQHFDAGRKAFEAGQFQQALTEFKSSLELQPSPNTRLYIARCFRQLGKIASAFTNFKLTSREATDRLNATGEKRYGATRDAANTEAGEIEAKVPRLTVAVPSDVPEGFVVKLDGADLPKAAWGTATETDPGPHTIEATGPRLVPMTEKFDLREGQNKRVDLRAARQPTAFLSVQLRTQPAGLSIEIDGKPVELAVAEKKAGVDVGEHVVTVHAPGHSDFVWKKALANDEVVVVPVELKPNVTVGTKESSGGTPKWLFFVVAGASLVTLGAGTYVAIDAKDKSDEAQKVDPLLREPAVRDDVKSQAMLGNILLAGGGVLGIGAVILAFTTKWKSESGATPRSASASAAMRLPPPTLRPWALPGSAGLAAVGAF
jgi:hypothetical protein